MNTEQTNPTKNVVLVVYALYALAFISGITAVIGLIIAYIKKGDAPGSIYESHFSYQIRTFWWSLVWGLVAMITMMIGLGFIIAFAVGVWFIYRIVKGFLRINDSLPAA